MRTFILVLVLFSTAGIGAHAQDVQKPARNTQNTQLERLDPDEIVANALDRRIINRHDTLYLFYAVRPSKPIKTAAQKWYSWYGHDTVLTTAGSYNGRVLDGEYKVLYPGGNIRESGNFNMGLKTGVWKSWLPNGSLQVVEHWKNGEREGQTEVYDAGGKQTNTEPPKKVRHAKRKQADSTRVN